MDLSPGWRVSGATGLWICVLVFSLVLHLFPVCCIEVMVPEEITAVRGETVTLSCSFSSTARTTSKLSVDWAYTPLSGGLPHSFFHFFLEPFPPVDGQFKGRVKWLGNPSARDVSIQLLNASLNDNGTYTCSVQNLPDAHGQPGQTILTVTPKKVGVRFSDVAVLLLFILLPSGLIGLVMLVRMLCPCCSPTPKNSSLSHHSPIEVTDGEEYSYKQSSPKRKAPTCCELYFQDSDDEEYYLQYEKLRMEPMAESHC